MSTVKAVIFDMDGLLVDSEPWWREAERNIFGQLGHAPQTEDFERMMGHRIDEVVQHWYDRHPWQGPSTEAVRESIIDEVDRLVKTNAALLPGVAATVKFFRDKNVPVALASSSSQRLIESLMKHFGLYDLFDVIKSAEHEPFGKPHPAVFLTTAAALGIPPVHHLVFEDSFNGVVAAKAARMRCVAVPAPEHREQTRFTAADLVLGSLEEFSEKEWSGLNI